MSIWPSAPDSEFKSFVYEQFSRIGKAISSPKRLIIMNILCNGEHTVESLATETGLSVANLSRHLQVLKSANLVGARREGKYTYYRLADDRTCAFFTSLKDFAYTQLVDIRAALEEISQAPSRLQPVGREELEKMVEDEAVVVVDVRPHQEYQQGHLPGAISMPLRELEERLKDLPPGRPIVAYCRGRYCILADQAIEILAAKGLEARRADDGLVEWRSAGFPVEGED